MEFIKFPSLENHYQTKAINYWLQYNPTLSSEKFIITEKMDGANFCIVIPREGEVYFQSRNNALAGDASFFDFQSALERDMDKIMKIKSELNSSDLVNEVRIYGELFGNGVQRRVDYGTGRYFLPFEVVLDGEILPPKSGLDFMESFDMVQWWVPILGYADSLEQAMEFNVEEVPTKHQGTTENGFKFIEGVVIAPYENVFHNTSGSRFLIKKKAHCFGDISGQKTKDKKPEVPLSESGTKLINIWVNMFSDNRLEDLFSKMGRIEEHKQIGEYLKAFSADVKGDFLKNHLDEFKYLPDTEKGKILKSAQSRAVAMIKANL